MSLYGALMTGVAGLNANSLALSVASSNIANVNTVGYKNATSSFSTLLASASGSGDPSSAGVIARAGQNVAQQGLLTTTQSATDLAISGNGFFVVSKDNTGNGVMYTRAGAFTPDAAGDLRNASGLYLMGWPLDSAGNPPTNPNTMTTINLNNLAGKAAASSTLSLQANLQASTTAVGAYTAGDMQAGTVTPQFQRTLNVYDSQGGSQPLQFSFVKTGANTWAYEVSYQGPAANIGGAGNNPITTGTMSFNSDGSLKDTDTATAGAQNTIAVTIPWAAASGLSAQALTVDMGTVGNSDGMSQFDTPSALTNSVVDGAVFGSVTGVTIGEDGIVSAQFSNGLSQNVFKLPIATFTNPNGLSPVSGNAYTTTVQSGTPIISSANSGGAGTILAKQLESSTVDLATEFTNLITTQRAYSASARIVTTASDMLDNLLQMSR
jgi:flagellar hook protein FlgE